MIEKKSMSKDEYWGHFWDALRGKHDSMEVVGQVHDAETGGFALPAGDEGIFDRIIRREGLFRNLATMVRTRANSGRIIAKDCSDLAAWVPENGAISLADGMNDFTTYAVDRHKLMSFVKLDNDFVHDMSFDLEEYLVNRLAGCFARAEDDGFLNGDGVDKPTGILHPEKGAETGVTASALAYDDVVKLFFSVKPEYRKNGVWLMNDETALALRTLKDNDDNYLWNHCSDTILGKRVEISKYMPGAESGKAPVLFGDFRYYWIVSRSSVTVKPITEKYVTYDQTGYLASEFLDGRLIRREAVKALRIAE